VQGIHPDGRRTQSGTSGAPSGIASSDEISSQMAKPPGEIVVAPVGPHVPMKVPSGLIHEWAGAVFFPSNMLDELLSVVRDYDRYKDFFRRNVIESKRISTTDARDEFSLTVFENSRAVVDSVYWAPETLGRHTYRSG